MKIITIITATILLSTLTGAQPIGESNITSKHPIQETKVLSTILPNLFNKSNINAETLNNKSLTTEKAISNGDIVEIPSTSWISSKTHGNLEVYNIKKLDEFMENIKNERNDRIRIVMYAHENGKTWVNKLYDLDYDGNKIKLIVYDTYSNPNAFIPNEPHYYDKIIKRDYPNDLWYGICQVTNEGDNCVTLISLKKSSIIK
jgi:hypothetical protein